MAHCNTFISASLGSVYIVASFPDPVQLSVACNTEFEFSVHKWGEPGNKATYMQLCKNNKVALLRHFCANLPGLSMLTFQKHVLQPLNGKNTQMHSVLYVVSMVH